MKEPHKTGCLVCGNKNANRRGLCQTHYKRFKAKLESFVTQEEADEFERECEALGWITPKSSGGRPRKDDDPFEEIAKQVKRASEIPSQAQPDDDVQDATSVDVGKKRTAKAKPLPTAAELRDAAKDTDKGTAKRGRRSG